ncbi:MAG: hypothetical protein HYW33_02810 [Candidatus Blackburnbacteria bacterium]|nr:hypothetical protein [Candidatus Blackburnbacteria bacterium]
MTNQEVQYAKTALTGKISSLRNDFSRAYFNLNQYSIQTSPFPILMFTMSVVDFFSALLAGWSESSRNQNRFQTTRMIDFCVNQLGYGRIESTVLVKVHRHSLMHTSDPRIRSNQNGIYGWQIMNINPNHMHLSPQPNQNNIQVTLLDVGTGNLIDDLENFLTTSGGYFELLDNDPEIQANYMQCIQELDSQTI